MTDALRTPLYDLHLTLGGRMVEFAGWDMPVQFAGVLAEHNHTRNAASLFDVSHMGQILLHGAGAAKALETLVPADIQGLAPDRQRYGVFTGPDGGILDDLMIANKGGHLMLVVNAARAEHDLAHLRSIESEVCAVEPVMDRALMALQGPLAAEALEAVLPGLSDMRFMDVRDADWRGATLWVSRSGYTGEDGFEISVPADIAEDFARALLAQPQVAPAGLGARDSLRLEAGLPLYGHDMDDTVTPAEAGLGWSIQKIRRLGGAREGGFPGAERVLAELASGPARLRRGLRPEGRAPIREGVALFAGDAAGTVTSGTFGPTVGAPVAMALLPAHLSPGDVIEAELRGRRIPVAVAELPFVPPSYKR